MNICEVCNNLTKNKRYCSVKCYRINQKIEISKGILPKPPSSKGKPSWNKGLTMKTDSRVKGTFGFKNKKHSKDTLEKFKKIALKRYESDIERIKQSERMKNREFTDEHKLKIKISVIKRVNSPDYINPRYIDGRSFLPYCEKFNDKFKEEIRKRDNYTCQLCGKTQEENGRKLDVHHIHHDKQNCYPDCIALCRKCNVGTVEIKETMKYYEDLLMNNLNNRSLLLWKVKYLDSNKN